MKEIRCKYCKEELDSLIDVNHICKNPDYKDLWETGKIKRNQIKKPLFD